MPIKVLVISHAYVAYENRKKLEELAKLKNIELTLIVPKFWKDTLRTVPLEKPETANYKIVSANTAFNGRISRYIYTEKLWNTIKEFKPDIIQLEEEPWSFTAFQVLLFKKMQKLQSKIGFFTWENIERNYKLPLKLIEKFVFKRSDFAIAGTEEAKKILIKKGFTNQIEVMPQLGVDGEVFCKQDQAKLRSELGLKDFTIGFFGRLVKEKGIFLLLEAFLKLKDRAQLFLMGEGPEKQNIRNFIRRHNLDLDSHVIMHDTVPHYEMPRYINCVDIVVLPSISTKTWKEQFGHILIEAFACEVPGIGSSSGAIPEVINGAGLVFEEGSSQELYKNLLLLIEDKNKYIELSRKARKICLEKYTNSSIANKLVKIYQTI